MAITGAAAIVGGIATAGGVAAGVTLTTMATIIGVAGLAITAVGMITHTPWLTKIGGGLGLAGGVASAGSAIGSAAGAAGATADATTTSINTASAVTPGVQASGDLAATNLAADGVTVGGPMSATTGVTATPLGDVAASSYGGVEAGTSAAGGAAQSAASTPVDTATQAALNPAQGTTINNALASQSPASQVIADSGGNVNAVNANAPNINPANVNTPNTVANNIAAPSSVTPVGQNSVVGGVPTPSAVGGPITGGYSQGNAYVGQDAYGFSPGTSAGDLNVSNASNFNVNGLDAGTLNGTGPGVQSPGNFFANAADKIGQWYSDLSPNGKLTVGQMGMGLLQGVGTGVASIYNSQQQLKLAQAQQDFEHANMSGAASVPKVGVMPSYGANPYTNANSQATTTATTTPAYTAPRAGLINSAQV